MGTNTDIFIGEYGTKKPIYINAEYDISSATTVLVVMSASAGTFTATCSVLAANYTASATDSIFSAGKTAELILASGDFSAQPATYKAWLDVRFSGSRLISSSFKFKVSNPGD